MSDNFRIEKSQNVCVALFLSGANGTNAFDYALPDLGFEPDVAIIRQISFSSVQLINLQLFHIWSDLTNNVIAVCGGSLTTNAHCLFCWTSNPQTVLKFQKKRPIKNIKFQILASAATNIPNGGLEPSLIPMVFNYSGIGAELTLHLDFIKYAPKQPRMIKSISNECVSVHMTGIVNSFYHKVASTIHADECVIRQIALADVSPTLNQLALWSDLNNDYLGNINSSTSTNSATEMQISTTPQSVIVLDRNKPMPTQINFQLHQYPIINVLQNSTLLPLVPSAQNFTNAKLCILMDFIEYE